MPLTAAAAQQVAQQIVSELNIPSDVQQEALTKWTNVVAAIFAGIQQNALVVPTALVAPTTGGPVTGVGMVE